MGNVCACNAEEDLHPEESRANAVGMEVEGGWGMSDAEKIELERRENMPERCCSLPFNV